MEARMTHPVMLVPDAMHALQALHKATSKALGDSVKTELVHLRASQINGCSVCVDMHSRELKASGEPDERIWAVGAWRESPLFTAEERAALDLTEAVTRLSDRSDPVPDDVWAAAADHFDDTELAGLVLAIASINVWNRLNAATRQIVGAIPG
jgi:AhpD family alkylhydroperoxidase